MKFWLVSIVAAASFGFLTGCHSSVRPLEPIASVENSCRHGSPKGPGILSIIASIANQPPTFTGLSTATIRLQNVKAGGVIAHWHDLELYLPDAAKVDGNSEGYLHISQAALDTPPADAQSRTVLLYMHGSRGQGWYKANAFDVQNPCIEGTRQS